MHIDVTAVSAIVTWKPPSKSSLNGNLTIYRVILKESDGKDLKYYDINEDEAEFQDLKPFTDYLVQVAACNFAGCGPMSPDLTFTTLQAGKLVDYTS